MGGGGVFLGRSLVIIKENNSILFKTLVSFLLANYCMRKLSQMYFKRALYSSCNILRLILIFLRKTPSTKHEFYKSPLPKSEQDSVKTAFCLSTCEVIFDKFPIELLIMQKYRILYKSCRESL